MGDDRDYVSACTHVSRVTDSMQILEMILCAYDGASSQQYGEHKAIQVHNGSLEVSKIVDRMQQCKGRVKILSKEAAYHTVGK